MLFVIQKEITTVEKYCKHCGAPLNAGGKFCAMCGMPAAYKEATDANEMQAKDSVVSAQPLNIADNQSVPITPPATNDLPLEGAFASTVPEKKKSKSKMLILALMGIIAVIAAVVCFVLFSKDSDSTGTDEDDNNEAYNSEINSPSDSEYESEDAPAHIEIENPTRTIMIYMVASDLESSCGAATLDLIEMAESDFDTSRNNVIICAGGTDKWQNDIMSDEETGIYQVIGEDTYLLESLGTENMGESSTLTYFLEYSEENFSADRFDLILWNHGGGPLLGFGYDTVSYDLLTIDELSRALKSSPFNKNNRLEAIGFDACLMGSIETAWIFKDYAEYFIASQEVEPGYGWNYEFLGKLDDCDTGADMGKEIIDSYFDYYEELYDDFPRYESEITLSCVDLTKIGRVEKCIDNLFSDINEEVIKGEIKEVSRCRYRTKAFGKFGSTMDYDLIDLGHLNSLLSDEYEKETESLENALEEYIIYSRSNVRNANGVSIYHPYDNLSVTDTALDVFDEIGFASDYAEYIENFSYAIENDKTSSNTYRDFSSTPGTAKLDGQQSEFSVKLTAEQVQTFSGAQYYVFKELPGKETFSGETEYLHIFSGIDATLSKDGTLSATYQGKAVFAKDCATNKYSSFPLSKYQIYDGADSEKYYLPCMFYDYGDSFADLKLLPVNWLMKIKNGKPTLLGAYDMVADTDNSFPDKYLIDSEDYDVYHFANNSYTFEYDSNGNIQFVFTDSSYGFEYTKENGFELELKPVDYDDGYYYAVFVIEDIYGNNYTSDLIHLK